MNTALPDPPVEDIDPKWQGVGEGGAFLRGLMAVFSIPGLVITASAMGFGALARDLGFTLGHATFMMLVFYALPAQVVVLDELGRGLSVFAAAFAVTLVGIRLMPMTVSIMPLLKDPKGRRWREIYAVHCVAVTAWLEGQRRLTKLPEHLRLAYFLGFGSAFVWSTVFGAAVGFLLAGSVPVAFSAALLFMTPIYFFLSLLEGSRTLADRVAVGLGLVLGPLFYLAMPGWDLLLAGLVGGTIAHVAGRGR